MFNQFSTFEHTQSRLINVYLMQLYKLLKTTHGTTQTNQYIFSYLSQTLQQFAPKTSKALFSTIQKKLSAFSKFPLKHPDVN